MNDCKGCRTYIMKRKCRGRDALPKCCGIHSHICPCLICIIKSMCADACEPFIRYEERYVND